MRGERRARPLRDLGFRRQSRSDMAIRQKESSLTNEMFTTRYGNRVPARIEPSRSDGATRQHRPYSSAPRELGLVRDLLPELTRCEGGPAGGHSILAGATRNTSGQGA